MPNDEQAEYWDGPGGEHWVAEAYRYSRMTGPLGEVLVEAADPQPGERVLDVGCGMGATTLAAAERVLPGGSALGVDLSGPMLAVARERANRGGLTHVAFEQADAQVRPFDPGSFDLAISRFGVMFFDDPNAAFANLGRALRSGGRLEFVCWQGLFDNEWLAVPVAAALQHVPVPEMGEPGAPGPFSLADAGH
ncbi:MAG TPA: methyltransferase domain-containing protein, partial [Acidimicrobiia bacterium]|nr:methyltransferase domain-containing protein [Acidimicrobiia bacterium]